MMNAIGSVINQIDSLVWGWWMIILLLGTHIFMTIRTGVIQRKIGTAIRLSVTKDTNEEGEVSQFGALTTALASTIGTGNIIGVGGLNMRWLGLIFAFFGGFASFGIGCATQVNAIATVCNENLHISPAAIGIAVAVLTALVIFGGIKSIANVCERLVPFMAFFYVIGCIIILGINFDFIIPAVKTICKFAFTPGAAAGGLVGRGIMMAMQYGIARGLFSNESGMGSAPIAAAAAQTRNPVRQALVSSTGTFWDTVVVCLMTGLVLVTSIMKNPSIDMGNITDGGVLTTLAFQQIPVLGPVILVVGIISFAYSTVLGWAYYGERCVEYFSGKKGLIPYRVLYIAVAAISPVISLNLVWTVADILNALMAIPNLIAVLLLSNVIVKETKKYINDLDARDDTPVEVIDK